MASSSNFTCAGCDKIRPNVYLQPVQFTGHRVKHTLCIICKVGQAIGEISDKGDAYCAEIHWKFSRDIQKWASRHYLTTEERQEVVEAMQDKIITVCGGTVGTYAATRDRANPPEHSVRVIEAYQERFLLTTIPLNRPATAHVLPTSSLTTVARPIPTLSIGGYVTMGEPGEDLDSTRNEDDSKTEAADSDAVAEPQP